MTKITACVASLALFIVSQIRIGGDPLQLLDQNFLQEPTIGNVSSAVYMSNFALGTCIFENDYNWYDFSNMNDVN